MPTIVFQTNSHGIKYAYESVSYWDKDKKAPRSRRKYIGKVDPETGEIIPPKPKRNAPTEEPPSQDIGTRIHPETVRLRSELARKDKEIEALKKELADITEKYGAALDTLSKIRTSASELLKAARG